MCRVVNRHKEKFDVYIGRGTVWGNPYRVDRDGTRKQVIAKYAVHLDDLIRRGVITKQDLLALDGKLLGCSCKPKACHGDVIVDRIRRAKMSLW